MKTFIIGITGGSGSGKTYLSNQLIENFSTTNISIIQMDSYYKNLKHLPMNKREKNNFDHPDAFDFDLLIKHLNILFEKKNVKIPIKKF
mgnify:CR=1 FL=1